MVGVFTGGRGVTVRSLGLIGSRVWGLEYRGGGEGERGGDISH